MNPTHNKPYLKKIEEIAGFTVWLVDGDYIKKNINKDFVNYDQHYHLKVIPENEFWIDIESSPDERRYYIDHLLIENRLMKEGTSYEKAYEKAASVERRERSKSDIVGHMGVVGKRPQELINMVHKKLLEKYGGKLKIWTVDGEIVRDVFYLDFAEGGHGKVYGFIPEDEIWIEDSLSQRERKLIILHEMHERNLMEEGADYHSAHKSATEFEDFCRRYTNKLAGAIKGEINKL